MPGGTVQMDSMELLGKAAEDAAPALAEAVPAISGCPK